MLLDNHHGDGRFAVWCAAPAGDQQLLVAADAVKFFVPPYVGHRGWLGVRLDAPANDRASARINSEGSAVDVLVIPTSEETVIARYCAAMLTRLRGQR